MNVAREYAKQLRAKLKLDREEAERHLKERESRLADDAARAERDAIAVAKAVAEDEQRRCEAEWARRLEREARRGFDLHQYVGTVAERQAALDLLGCPVGAVAKAASCAGWQEVLVSDAMTYTDANGVKHAPADSLVNVVAALLRLADDQRIREQRVTTAAERDERQRILNEMADRQVAEYREMLAVQQKMEA